MLTQMTMTLAMMTVFTQHDPTKKQHSPAYEVAATQWQVSVHCAAIGWADATRPHKTTTSIQHWLFINYCVLDSTDMLHFSLIDLIQNSCLPDGNPVGHHTEQHIVR